MVTNSWRPGKRVAIIGGGPAAISTGLAFIQRGYDVKIFERASECRAIGGAVLLSVPVLAILRWYGIKLDGFGAKTVTYFKNKDDKVRVRLPFNKEVNKLMGIEGWHYGVLRSTAFQQMLDVLPQGVIHTDFEFTDYAENENMVEIGFKNGEKVTADILVGSDGIRSQVSRQMLGDPQLFHTGIRLWLAWCDYIPGIAPNYGVVSHDWQHQASFFPMVHDGKKGFEWWVVEPSWEGKPVPENIKSHLEGILGDWSGPLPRLMQATNIDTQVYRWEIYNRPSLKKWSSGRVMCIGDAVHPVSPYAAYGMGMAIEDGYYLAKFLDGTDLRDPMAITRGFEAFEKQRVDYVNHNMEFARFLGKVFHSLPYPLAWVRDLIFDYTPFLKYYLTRGYLAKAEEETLHMEELRVN